MWFGQTLVLKVGCFLVFRSVFSFVRSRHGLFRLFRTLKKHLKMKSYSTTEWSLKSHFTRTSQDLSHCALPSPCKPQYLRMVFQQQASLANGFPRTSHSCPTGKSSIITFSAPALKLAISVNPYFCLNWSQHDHVPFSSSEWKLFGPHTLKNDFQKCADKDDPHSNNIAPPLRGHQTEYQNNLQKMCFQEGSVMWWKVASQTEAWFDEKLCFQNGSVMWKNANLSCGRICVL